jgi:hypothetical protein
MQQVVKQQPASQPLEGQVVATQALPLQYWPLGQTVPHCPQLAESVLGSEQLPLQQVWEAGQAGVQLMPPSIGPPSIAPVVPPVVPAIPPVVVEPPVVPPVAVMPAVVPLEVPVPLELEPAPVEVAPAVVPEVELAAVPVVDPAVLPLEVVPLPVVPLLVVPAVEVEFEDVEAVEVPVEVEDAVVDPPVEDAAPDEVLAPVEPAPPELEALEELAPELAVVPVVPVVPTGGFEVEQAQRIHPATHNEFVRAFILALRKVDECYRFLTRDTRRRRRALTKCSFSFDPSTRLVSLSPCTRVSTG